MTLKKLLRHATLTLWIYGLLGWLYIVLNAVVHQETLSLPLTHLLSWPREDTFGAICFAVSIASFFFWNVLREE
jgi:hypothetical protein